MSWYSEYALPEFNDGSGQLEHFDLLARDYFFAGLQGHLGRQQAEAIECS